MRDPISAEALQLLANKCWSASSPPDPWLTREPLYITPSGFDPKVERQNTTRCTQSFPAHGLRAQDRGRVGASRTFVRVGVHLLGWRPTITFLGNVFDTTTRYCSIVFLFVIGALCCWRERRSTLHPFCTSSGTTTPKALCRLASAWMPLCIIYFDCLLFYILSTYSQTMLDQIFSWTLPLVCFCF
jgi:hypothetical protein